MSWLLLSIVSALLLGFYDYFKKLALRTNDVMPVLSGSVIASAAIWLPIVGWSAIAPATLPHASLDVAHLDLATHLSLLAKSALVASSWWCGYNGLKSLPLSIAAPIRSTGPLWTIGMAVLIFGEDPSARQWLGILLIIGSFMAFTLVGKREKIRFHRDKGVFFMLAATLLGAGSALYDKHLLQTAELSPTTVQAWFTVYLAVILTPALFLDRRRTSRAPFRWHWAIPVIGVTLLAADILYFLAISQPEALISLISPVRRSSVIVAFLLGIFLFRERQFGLKGLCVLGILSGLLLLS